MTTYAVEFTKSASKELKKLHPEAAKKIAIAIDKLSHDPRKGNVRPMTGVKSWRLRVGDYRVVYDINDGKLIILIIRVRPRGSAYRNN